MFDPQRGYPRLVPYVRYADPCAGARWLEVVLGAREALRMTMPDGRVAHLELTLGEAVVSVGLRAGDPADATPTRETLPAMVLAFVDDVDAAAQRAVAEGGTLVDAPADQPWGLRQAIVADPGGHLWELSAHVRDVPAQEWGADLHGTLPG